MMSPVLPSPPPSASSEALARAGFTPISATHYQRRALHLAIGPHWCVIEAPDSPIPLNTPGLWKRVGTGGEARRVFILPRRIWDDAASANISFDRQSTSHEPEDSGAGFQPVAGASSPRSDHGQDARTGWKPAPLPIPGPGPENSLLDQCLQWALATVEEPVSSTWQPPARAEVESWFKADHLTVVAGSVLRQGEVICERGQLAIRFQLVPELPADLPASRRAWLGALLDEAQDRWHLVRLGVATDADSQSSVVAEVDLTGVPHELAQDLFVISLEALRWVVQWLGETTDWLADVTVASELLAVCPDQQS